jgi:hypothetical protein
MDGSGGGCAGRRTDLGVVEIRVVIDDFNFSGWPHDVLRASTPTRKKGAGASLENVGFVMSEALGQGNPKQGSTRSIHPPICLSNGAFLNKHAPMLQSRLNAVRL